MGAHEYGELTTQLETDEKNLRATTHVGQTPRKVQPRRSHYKKLVKAKDDTERKLRTLKSQWDIPAAPASYRGNYRRLASVVETRNPEYSTAMVTSGLLLFVFFVFILRRFTAKHRKW